MPRTAEQIERHRERRKGELLLAAQRVFSRAGFHAANISDVASEAGVSQGTVYHYFESKEELLIEVYTQWETANLSNEIEQAIEQAPTATKKLEFLGHAASKRIASNLQLLQASVEFWSHIPRNSDIRKGFRKMFARMAEEIAQVIHAGVKSGEFQNVNETVLARLFIATYDGLILQWLTDRKSVDWDTCTETLITIMLHGLSRSNR